MTSSSFSLTRPSAAPVQGALLSALRIVTGLLYVCHGASKLFGVFGAGVAPGQGKAAHLASLLGVAGVIELVAGTLICLGLFTQIAAFVCSGEMAVAYFRVHIERSIWPILNRGETVVLFCFIFLYFAVAGGGPYSLDAVLRKSRGAPTPPHRQ